MITSTNIERKIDLNFPVAEVKQSIERVVKQGAYAMHSKNEVFNTYSIGKMTGLESIIMNITLQVLENNNTNIHIVVTEQIRNSGHQMTVNQMIDAFLERLSKALTGAPDEALKTVSAGNKGCAVTLIIMVSLAIAASASAAAIIFK
jgi:hypothetical protein